MFVVLTRASAVPAVPWGADDPVVFPEGDEGGWLPQPSGVWPVAVPVWLAATPDELPYLPLMQDEGWQPPLLWVTSPPALFLAGDADTLPVALDEDGWFPSLPWPFSGVSLPLSGDVDGLLVTLDDEGWRPPLPWALPWTGLLLWVADDAAYLPWMQEDGWLPPPPWSAEVLRLSLLLPGDADGVTVALGEEGWQPPPPWVLVPPVLQWVGEEVSPPAAPTLGEDGWSLPVPWGVSTVPLAWASDEALPIVAATLGVDDDGWQPPVVWLSLLPRWVFSATDDALYLPWLGEDAWLPPAPWAPDWRLWWPGADEAVPPSVAAVALETEGWAPLRSWAADSLLRLLYAPDEVVPQPALAVEEGWCPPVLWRDERLGLPWQDPDWVPAVEDDTDAGMLPRPWPVLLAPRVWQEEEVWPTPLVPFWLTTEDAWWPVRQWPEWWRPPHLVTEHVWEAWTLYVPPVIPIVPVVPSSPLVSSEEVLVPGRWLGRTLVLLEATAATAGQGRLVVEAVVPSGTRILGVGYLCTTAFGTTGGLTAVDIGDATLQDRWGYAIGITVGTETGYGFGLGESVESLDAVALWLSAVGGVFDAVGACTLNVVWERTAVP